MQLQNKEKRFGYFEDLGLVMKNREKNVKFFDERECKNENDKGKIKMGGLRKIMGELM
jgi:hypothetical protein